MSTYMKSSPDLWPQIASVFLTSGEPWPVKVRAEDLRWHAFRVGTCHALKLPSESAFARRWGVGRRQARKTIRPWLDRYPRETSWRWAEPLPELSFARERWRVAAWLAVSLKSSAVEE